MDQMTSAVYSVSTRAGPLRSQDDLAMELDLSHSDKELERRHHQGIEADFSPDKHLAEVAQKSHQIMDSYKQLQFQI